MQHTRYKPGSLVRFRDREWMVLPSEDPEFTLLKPLGGSEEEITGVFHKLNIPGEEIEEADFPPPSSDDLGDFETAKLAIIAANTMPMVE